MASVGGFAFRQNGHGFTVGLRPNSTENAVHPGKTGSAKQMMALKRLQAVDGLFKSGIQFSNGVVDVGFDRREFSGLIVKAAARGLRQVDAAFSFAR